MAKFEETGSAVGAMLPVTPVSEVLSKAPTVESVDNEFSALQLSDDTNNNPDTTLLFQTGWFFESLLTQVMVIYVLRTPKIPFIQSSPSFKVNSALIMVILAGTILVLVPGLETANLFSSLASRNVDPKAPFWILYAILLVIAYVITSQLGKVAYKKIFREWI